MVLLRPCSTSAGYMANPEQPRRLNMPGLRAALEDAGYDIKLDARVLLLVSKDVESTIYAHGRVLMKTTSKDEAVATYADLEPHLHANW